jgi:predicted DNA-binding protein YlxM (UPF0122 family)
MNKTSNKIKATSLAVSTRNALHDAGFDTVERRMSLQPERDNLANADSIKSLKYLEDVLMLPLSEIALSIRAKNVLKKMKLVLLHDLVSHSPKSILKRRNSGIKTLKEIVNLLSGLELNLGMRLSSDLEKEISRRRATGNNYKSTIDRFKKQYPEKAEILAEKRSDLLSKKKIYFYMRCYRLYKNGLTLEDVGKEVGISKQRVSQILIKGADYELFKYNPHNYTYIPKQQLMNDIIRLCSLSKVAVDNKVPKVYLKRMLFSYGLNRKKIDKLISTGRKRKIIDKYLKIKDELGHYPTTTELQARPDWRTLGEKIRRTWKTIYDFRNELNIPSPPPFVESIRPWLEHRMRLALIRRMQDLDTIRETLTVKSPLQTKEIAIQCKLSVARTFKLTQLLISTGEVLKEGAASKTRYRIIKSRG